MFIPADQRAWNRSDPRRRCHWCASGPHRVGELIQVLELPMRYHFCTEQCMHEWQQRRHDADVLAWLKLGAGERAKILKERRDD